MAPTINTASTVGTVLAGITASVDIPKPRGPGFWAGRDTFASVTARAPPSKNQPMDLPTPPNSISPSIPPQGYGRRATSAPPTPPAPVHVDSDLDLQDALDHANAQDYAHHGRVVGHGLDGLGDMDTAGAITPGLLAKHHLPGILLENGPLAIRHVMGYLTTSVPGFSGIPPAKARRLVVGALEGRGGGGEQDGINGEVIFEKVGWGRWDARRRGQPARDARSMRQHPNPRTAHPPPTDHLHGLPTPGDSRRPARSRKIASGASIPEGSVLFSHDSEMEYLDHDAEKMSLDGDNSCSTPESLEDGPMLDYELDDATDEEDWASIGAAALRQGSFPRPSVVRRARTNHSYHTRRDHNARRRGGGPPSSIPARSTSRSSSPLVHHHQHSLTVHDRVVFPASPVPDGGLCGSDPQEREAIEALVKLSSV